MSGKKQQPGQSPGRIYDGLEAPAGDAQTPRKDLSLLSEIPSTADFYGLAPAPSESKRDSLSAPKVTTSSPLAAPLQQFVLQLPGASQPASSAEFSQQASALLPGIGDALAGSVLSEINDRLNAGANALAAASSSSSLESQGAEDPAEAAARDAEAEAAVAAGRQFVTMQQLLENNRRWAHAMINVRPDFFARLANQQAPPVLWIGCSDSRVPANQILALEPGQVFVHRNIANVVVHTDLNCASVLQLAVDVLKVRHVIVCGHYGCSGVFCATQNRQYGLVDNWLRHIKDIYHQHTAQLEKAPEGPQRADLMCELNVTHSVRNVCASTVIQNAWDRGQTVHVHGWCYRLTDGIIRDLKICAKSRDDLPHIYRVLREKSAPEH